jgi:hypothetical protein
MRFFKVLPALEAMNPDDIARPFRPADGAYLLWDVFSIILR